MRAQPIISLQRAESPDDEGLSRTDMVLWGDTVPKGREHTSHCGAPVFGDNVSSQPWPQAYGILSCED